MIMGSLQPRFARHLMRFLHLDFGSLVQTLYGIEEGIAKGLWPESSLSDLKGKKPTIRQRLGDVNAISATRLSPLDIMKQLSRLSEFITCYHPRCSIGHRFLLDPCLPCIYTQLLSQFILLKPYRGHLLIIPSLGLHLYKDRCSSFPS